MRLRCTRWTRGRRSRRLPESSEADKPVSRETDENRLAVAARDDPDACAALCDRFRPFVYWHAHRWRHRDFPLEDRVQIATEGLLKAVRRYRPEAGSFKGWASIMIRAELSHAFRNHDRNNAPTVPLAVFEDEETGQPFFGEFGEVDGGFERAEDAATWETVAAAVATLDARARRALSLYYADGLPQSEIGRELGCSQMHACRILRRAVNELRLLVAA